MLPLSKDYEQVDLQVHHWEINDWNALEQRAHGPVFEAAGYQWYTYTLFFFLHKISKK